MRFWTAIVFSLMVSSAWGDDIDTLFDQAGSDIVAQQPEVKMASAAPMIRVSGATSFTAGLLLGQVNWGSGWKGSGLYTMEGSLSFDARPDPRIRAWAVVNTTSTGIGFTTPTINEFFFDYTMAESVVFRIGKQSLGWGQGRLFNPANLVADVAEGISFKAFTPFFGQSLTFVALAKDSENPAKPSWRELGYAAQLSGDWGPLGWGFAGRTRPGLDSRWSDRRASGFVRTTVVGTDLFAEMLWNSGKLHGLTGLFWEPVNSNLRVQVESTDERGGFAIKYTTATVKPGFQWTHIYSDGSGSLVGGIEWPVDGLTTVTFGLPVTYGSSSGKAMLENVDPAKRRWVAGVKFSLDASF